MKNETSFRQIASIATIMAGVMIIVSNIVLLFSVDFNFEFLDNPTGLLIAGLDPGAIGLFRWGTILELFGYCLFLIPATLYLWYWLRSLNPSLVTLYTILGLINIVFCVLESTIRASIWPPMMAAYPQAAEAQQQVLLVVFKAVTDFAFEGMYALDSILFGLWGLGMGLILLAERRVLGIVTVIMGAAILGAGVGWITRVDPLARLELFYLFEPFWAIWLGIVIWRGAEKIEKLVKAEVATAA